jgi:hypothetical protein
MGGAAVAGARCGCPARMPRSDLAATRPKPPAAPPTCMLEPRRGLSGVIWSLALGIAPRGEALVKEEAQLRAVRVLVDHLILHKTHTDAPRHDAVVGRCRGCVIR